jgi:hypothetical protein
MICAKFAVLCFHGQLCTSQIALALFLAHSSSLRRRELASVNEAVRQVLESSRAFREMANPS